VTIGLDTFRLPTVFWPFREKSSRKVATVEKYGVAHTGLDTCLLCVCTTSSTVSFRFVIDIRRSRSIARMIGDNNIATARARKRLCGEFRVCVVSGLDRIFHCQHIYKYSRIEIN
jgi:uncharacterized membrane protein YhfC